MPLPRTSAGEIDPDVLSHQQGLALPSAELIDIPEAFSAGAVK